MQPLATLEFFSFGLQIIQICKLLHFENVKIHKHWWYWKVFSTDIYRKIYFNSLLLFSYICWSVNCMSWVSKFNNFFLTCTETEAEFILEGFNIVLYAKFISDSLIHFLFFYMVCKLFKGLFQSLCQSVILWVESLNHGTYLEMSCSVSINLYLRPCGIAIYGKFYLYCLYYLRLPAL